MAFEVSEYFELYPESGIVCTQSILDGNFLYVAEIGWPAKIYKIDLTTKLEVTNITLDPEIIDYTGDGPAAMQDNDFLYFSCKGSSYRSVIVKIAKSSFSVISILNISNVQYWEWLSHAVYDSINNKAYFFTFSTIYKIDLATFTVEGFLECGANYYSISCIGIDSTSTYLYIGNNVSSSRLGKILISSFSIVNYIDTSSHAGVSSMAIDSTNGKIYLGTYPARDGAGAYIWKIDIATFTSDGSLHLPSGEVNLTSALVDPSCLYAYFLKYGNLLIRIDLKTFLRVDSIDIGGEEQQKNINYDSSKNIYIVANYDLRVAKIITECQLLSISSIYHKWHEPVVII